MGLNQSHRRTSELLIQELEIQQILTYETVSHHTEFYSYTIKHMIIRNWARNDTVECYIFKGNYSITDSHPPTRTQCTKYGQQVPRKVLQILHFEWWGVLLYIKFEVPTFGRYAPLPAVVPLLEAILQGVHCDPIRHCHCRCLKSSELANHHPFCSFNRRKW